MPLHGHAERVTNQQDFYARAVHQGGERGFVAGKHGDFVAVGLHGAERVKRYHGFFLLIEMCGWDGMGLGFAETGFQAAFMLDFVQPLG